MRGIVPAVLFLAMVLSAVHATAVTPAPDGTQKVTVEQLEQTVAAARQKPDADLALLLQSLELTERLSTARLTQLKAELPGDNSRQALTVLADSSAFLAAPAAEIPPNPPPDPASQRRIMALVVNYVTKTTHELPNFFATRETTRFEDRPQVTYSYLPLHFVGKSSRSVVYRNGLETADPNAGKAKRDSADMGLVSWGEFGPILSTVLLDAAQSKLVWSHWEQRASGPVAVFSYQVPSQKSHYEVQACCVGASVTLGGSTFKERAGYHGEMTVDPASGVILRVTVDAEMGPGDPLTRAAIMVEYGTVEIGGKSVICPERSVALSRMEYAHVSNGARSVLDKNPQQTLVNDVAFEQYHQLRGDTRILTDGATDQDPGSPVPTAEEAAAAAPQPAPTSTAPPSPQPDAAAVPTPPAAPVPPAAAPEPEISVAAASAIPDAPADTASQPSGGFVLKLTSRLVDVGLVAVDKKGRPVTDLKAADFEVYDTGRKQEVKFFSIFAPAQETSGTGDKETANTFSNRIADAPAIAASPATAPTSVPGPIANATILLFDESHIAWGDLTHARQETIKFLANLPPGEKVALYTMSGLGFRVLTEVTGDHAALIARLQKWMPTAQSVSTAQQDEARNRQQFETVHNVADLASVNGNQSDMPDGETPVDPQLLALGSDPARASLLILRGVARHLAAVPGHKNLVWISSDNVFADWRDQQVGTDKVSNGVDIYALHAQEAMNDAHVSVYPFDVSQLEAGGIGAELGNRNVELNPTTTVVPPGGGVPRGDDAGRTKASMLQDLHPIQGSIRQVAEATGGRTVRRASDLAAALAGILDDERATYQLSFYPDTPADGKYHPVTVKLDDRKSVTLRYRTGYLYAKEPATIKERFQQAIWQPGDANEIKVTAAVPDAPSGTSVKINIAASDLDFVVGGGRRIDVLDIFFIQRDDAGLHAKMEGQSLGLRLLPATYQNVLTAGIPFEHPVKVKQDTASLRIIVIDRNLGRMGSVTIPAAAFSTTK